MSVLKSLLRTPWFWGVIGIVLLLSLNVIKDPTYLAVGINPTTQQLSGNLLDILRISAPIIMIALGMTFVIATKGIDLSVGSIMAVGGAAAMELLRSLNASTSIGAMFMAIGLALLLGAVLGLVNGLLVSVVGLQPFISTLVMMLAARGIARVITGGQNTNSQNQPFQQISNGQVLGLPISFVAAIVIVVIVAVIMRRTALGLMIESIGVNPDASRLAGIRPRPILITVYVLSGILAAGGGLFTVSEVMTVDVSGTGYQMELDAILAVVIGGTSLAGGKFSILGSTVGALLIATLNKTVLFLGVSAAATPAFKAIVIVLLVLLQSERVRTSVLQVGRRRTRKEVVA
ncbi:Fructose import permease protein FruF [Microbacterium sp. MM2322]|jgi:simple sugar transport system permease protein|uniref:ABC transporter permease n=3 Tax=Microbacterium TaxID=33882 RepID=UPI00178175C2|nr:MULTISPECIES: ABC transporter permease [unclassified Microbacterium]MBD8217219.1 ABC transporter permease [Microbacterium sp. CFBP 13617]MBD8508911.1 ABC transporter permease [Microbacterium sp. CFBP 8790]